MTPEDSPLRDFHPAVRRWFERAYGSPTPPQVLGWPGISAGSNTLILAPTGSGKTLAAFLWAINHLVEQLLREELPPGVRILYVSPLKALNNDIERNLERPLAGIREEAHREGARLPAVRVAVRTGDTTPAQRAAMLRNPPHILITTPESLYLMLTGKQARRLFPTVQYLIVDEIHALCGNKRGVHLSLSMERLQEVAMQEMVRIGLSATQRPLERVAAYLGGQEWRAGSPRPRPVTVVDAGRRKSMDLRVVCAPPDFSTLPQEGVWPTVFAELLRLIRNHTTTLVFVNNRRLAERVAAALNELAGNDGAVPSEATNLHAPLRRAEWSSREPMVQAYHGSMSRRARELMEAKLKAGGLRALVTTSALELGIDIGSIDLVVQLQSPRGVARGLQRVGRSGHLVSATSTGRVLPTHREDLVESAVVSRAMLDHEVEATAIPENCLDVLAQQIVAMVSVEDRNVDLLFGVVRQSYCYRSLARPLFDGVLRMLAGRYSQEGLRDIPPRISWDRVNGVLRALPGSSRVAVTSGGTIADRGAFGVYLEDGRTRVGEIDEEFVYETRVGDTFLLGSSVWRVTAIDASRVLVVPAPGEPARMPFWRGEAVGRSVELGRMIGAFRRELAGRLDDPHCLTWLQQTYPVDSSSAWNLLEYVRRQRDATGRIPDDRCIVVENFRDELGDPRVAVHCPLGRRVNSLLALVLSAGLHRTTGVEPEVYANDDGVLLRCPGADVAELNPLAGITPRAAEEAVVDLLLESQLFGGQFRQNAARALLLPRAAPGRRTPLYLQRLRAKDLLAFVRRFDDFPIVIETVREVLHDLLDLGAFRALLRQIETGSVEVHPVRTEIPSPFAAGLLFDFLAIYMYEWDQPKADRLSRYLPLNRELLSEVIDLEGIGALLRPEAFAAVEARLQHTTEGSRARSAEELMELLLRVGDMTDEEVAARCAGDPGAMIAELAADGRAARVPLAGGQRWVAGEERAVYADLAREGNARHVIGRYLQGHGPVTATELARRYGLSRDGAHAVVEKIALETPVARGRFRPPDADREDEAQWCYRPNIEALHRQTIAILRREIRPCTLAQLARFLFRWHHVAESARLSGPAGLLECLDLLTGLPLAAEVWERDILPTRLRDFAPGAIDRADTRAAFVWVGAGAGRVKLVPRGEGHLFRAGQPPADTAPPAEAGRRVLAYLQHHGASFFAEIRSGTSLSLQALNGGIAELFWSGLVTNDLFAEILRLRRGPRQPEPETVEPIRILMPARNPLRGRLMQGARRAIRQVPGWSGRWSLVEAEAVPGEDVPVAERAVRQAGLLLGRYGILAREFLRREELLPWPLIAAELQRMEMRGEIRRGYFVEGLSGMQYALPEAVEELRRDRPEDEGGGVDLLLNTWDPANPYGAGIPLAWPAPALRLARNAGTYVAFRSGEPTACLEGTRLWTPAEPDRSAVIAALRRLAALAAPARASRDIVLEHWNGLRPAGSSIEALLREAGFRAEANQSMRLEVR